MAEPAPATHRGVVLGSPVAHSLSPALHRAAYAALGLTGWRYDAIECDEATFPAVLAGLEDTVVGLSCTMPLKRAALAAADQVAPAAALVGAANTLLRHPGGWRADNTDVDGVIGALAEAGLTSAPGSVLLLGAGGTAQAAVVALARLGAAEMTVAAREPARATALRATGEAAGVRLEVITFPDRLVAELVVSTLPGDAAAGLAPRWTPGSRRPGDGRTGTLLDVVYAPWPTTLAAAARAGERRWSAGGPCCCTRRLARSNS